MMTLLESGLDALPYRHYEYGDWKIDSYPIPKSSEARGKPGTRHAHLIPYTLKMHLLASN